MVMNNTMELCGRTETPAASCRLFTADVQVRSQGSPLGTWSGNETGLYRWYDAAIISPVIHRHSSVLRKTDISPIKKTTSMSHHKKWAERLTFCTGWFKFVSKQFSAWDKKHDDNPTSDIRCPDGESNCSACLNCGQECHMLLYIRPSRLAVLVRRKSFWTVNIFGKSAECCLLEVRRSLWRILRQNVAYKYGAEVVLSHCCVQNREWILNSQVYC